MPIRGRKVVLQADRARCTCESENINVVLHKHRHAKERWQRLPCPACCYQLHHSSTSGCTT